MSVRTVQLGDVSAVSSGQGAPQNRDAFGFAGHPFIRAASLNALCEDGSFNSLERISEVAAKEHRLRLYAPGTVVFAKSGMSATKNRIYRLPRPAYVVSHLAAVVPFEQLDSVFLRYWLERFNPTRLIQDPAYPSISQEDIEAVCLPLPDLTEQRRIAELLEQADRLRRTRRYALELSDTFLPAAFFELFGYTAFPQLTLDELVLAERGSFVNGPFGSDLLTSELVSDGVPVIYIRDISEGRYVRTSTVCVTPAKAEELAIFEVHPGDVLVAKVGDPPGIAAIYPHGEPVGVITQDVIRMRLDPGLVLPRYLLGLLNSDVGMRLLKPIIVEGTRMRFGLTSFKEVAVPVPPLQLQRHFAALAERHERLRATQREALRQAEHLFQTLLHRAFSEGM